MLEEVLCHSLPVPRVGLQGLRMSLVRVHLSGQRSCLSHLEQTFSASVESSVTVTSQNYTNKLQDKSSKEFSDFNKTFTQQVILRELPPKGPSALHPAPPLPPFPPSIPGRSLEGLRWQLDMLDEYSSQLPQVLRASQDRRGMGNRVCLRAAKG